MVTSNSTGTLFQRALGKIGCPDAFPAYLGHQAAPGAEPDELGLGRRTLGDVDTQVSVRNRQCCEVRRLGPVGGKTHGVTSGLKCSSVNTIIHAVLSPSVVFVGERASTT
jgi:hypothetical protein